MFPNARRVSVNRLAVDVWVDRDPRVRDPRHGEGLLERLHRRKHEGSVKGAGYRKPLYLPDTEIVLVLFNKFETLKKQLKDEFVSDYDAKQKPTTVLSLSWMYLDSTLVKVVKWFFWHFWPLNECAILAYVGPIQKTKPQNTKLPKTLIPHANGIKNNLPLFPLKKAHLNMTSNSFSPFV